AQGLGQAGKKRHRKAAPDAIHHIGDASIRRLARRGGVKRMREGVNEEARGALNIYINKLLADTTAYTEHGKRKTVTALDVVYAVKRGGKTVYGFD
ncbi:histone-fold-containing protein, partial [Mycena vitilis]